MENLKIKSLTVNAISLYRILIAPILLLLIWKNEFDIFKWLLVISFFTDAIDGYLARHFKAVSDRGAVLDSVGDDLTVIVAIIGMFNWNYAFLWDIRIWGAFLILILLVQVTLALIKFGKMTAYHTYLSKTAAVLQAVFLSSCFIFRHPSAIFFYITAVTTAIDMLEEIMITIWLKAYQFDIKGLYWLLKKKKPKIRL